MKSSQTNTEILIYQSEKGEHNNFDKINVRKKQLCHPSTGQVILIFQKMGLNKM